MKFLIFALVLLVAGTQAGFPDMFANLRLNQVAPQDTKTDLLNFAQGFLTGVEHAAVFDEIKTCIADDEALMMDLQQGVALIRTKNPENVKKGVKKIGDAAQMIPAAAMACKIADASVEKIINLIKTFSNPQTFFYFVGKSLLINHVEVIHEIEGAVNAYEDKNMNQFGFWIGSAMATIFLGDKRTLRESYVQHTNENAGWEATTYKQFEGLTIEEIKSRYLGAAPIDLHENYGDLTVMDYEGLNLSAPESFDSSKQWPGCVHPIRDQQRCGSCWAFSATEVLSDRFCIASEKQVDVVLSPQYLLSCDTQELGCRGGYPVFSWNFIMKQGILTDDCLPYKSGSGVNPIQCRDVSKCEDGSDWKLYYAKKDSAVVLPNPASIQQNIMQYGPVEAGFMVYEDFMQYKGGVYKHKSGGLLGGHAVKVVGWGVENGTNYWIAANSWTSAWGENGFFRIAFGECNFDKACIAGQADLERLNQSKVPRWF